MSRKRQLLHGIPDQRWTDVHRCARCGRPGDQVSDEFREWDLAGQHPSPDRPPAGIPKPARPSHFGSKLSRSAACCSSGSSGTGRAAIVAIVAAGGRGSTRESFTCPGRRFPVSRIVRVPKAEFPTDLLYAPTLEPSFRLVRCGGRFDRVIRSYRDNVIDYADPDVIVYADPNE